MPTARDKPHPAPPAGFPGVGVAAWRRQVERELGEVPFEEALITRTLEGLDLEALATRDSWSPGREAAFPAAAGGWRIATEIAYRGPEEAAAAMRADQRQGARLLWLRFGGVEVTGDGDFEELAAAVEPGVEVVLDGGGEASTLASRWLAAARRRGLEPARMRGSFACDPLAGLVAGRLVAGSLQEAWRQMAGLTARALAETPAMRSILVSTSVYHDAGASLVDELSFSLATGTEYLRQATAAGLDLTTAARQIDFAFSVGRDLFGEIAKLRAARRLWSRVVRASGGSEEACKMRLHARTSRFEASRLAVRTNLLRGAVQTFAAVLGGADSIVTAPHDEVLGRPRGDARRTAIHLQHILAEEAHLARVADPAAGSWSVESLTDGLARAAWGVFQDLERRGGMARCILDDTVTERVVASAEQRRLAVATRRAPIVGTSAFVDLDEALCEPQPAGEDRVADAAMLHPTRRAEPFELLRLASDHLRRQRGRLLQAAIVQVGTGRGDEPSPSFIHRLLAVAGIEATLVESVENALLEDPPPDVVVLSGEDDAERLAELAARFTARGCRAVVLAGPDAELPLILQEAYVVGVLSDGGDVTTVLTSILIRLGGPS